MIWEGLLVSVLVCFMLDPLIFHLLRSLEIYDYPNTRSVHRVAILTMGGILIISGYCAGLLYLLFSQKIPLDAGAFQLFASILAGAFCMAILGSIDDLLDLGPVTKFLVESLIALLMCYNGLVLESINFFGIFIQLGVFSIPFTVLWIVGIINAINFMDGLDGLAGGICLIIILTLALSPQTTPLSGYFLPGLMGGIVIFLLRNSYPASIYMGDVGSLFLGFHVAVFSILVLPFDHPNCGPFGLLALLGIPLLDTIIAIIRRAYSHQVLFHADKAHIHHKLLEKMSHRNAVGLIYGISSLLSILVILSLGLETIKAQTALLLGSALILGGLLAYVYGMKTKHAEPSPELVENQSNQIE